MPIRFQRRHLGLFLGILFVLCACYDALAFFLIYFHINSPITYVQNVIATEQARATAEYAGTHVAQTATHVAPTLMAQPTIEAAAATVTAHTTWPTLVPGGFSTNALAWPTGRFSYDLDYGQTTIENGKYRIEITSHQGVFHWFTPRTPYNVSDFVLTAEAARVSGDAETYYGVTFRKQDATSRYLLLLGKSNYFQVARWDEGRMVPLIDWKSSPGILVNGPNKITVIGHESHFLISINGQYAGEFDDDHLTFGQVGLVVNLPDPGLRAAFEFTGFELQTRPNLPPTSEDRPLPQKPTAEFAPWPILLSDNFAVPTRSIAYWPSGMISTARFDGERTFIGGQYRWKIKSKQDGVLTGVANLPTVSDFSVKATAHRLEGPLDADYGLLLNYVNEENYDRFVIRGRQFALIERFLGQERTLVPYTTAAPISEDGVNHLAVDSAGRRLALYVNDVQVCETEAGTLHNGWPGFMVGLSANLEGTFEFSEFDIRVPK